jgi:hypothetical protein
MNTNSLRRFDSDHFVLRSRVVGTSGILGGLACVATAWLEPEFRLTSLVAAALSLGTGLSLYFARPPTVEKRTAAPNASA